MSRRCVNAVFQGRQRSARPRPSCEAHVARGQSDGTWSDGSVASVTFAGAPGAGHIAQIEMHFRPKAPPRPGTARQAGISDERSRPGSDPGRSCPLGGHPCRLRSRTAATVPILMTKLGNRDAALARARDDRPLMPTRWACTCGNREPGQLGGDKYCGERAQTRVSEERRSQRAGQGRLWAWSARRQLRRV
jgi:hypothetical protein